MPEALDTAVTLETPEGTEIEVRPAGLFARGLAFLLDELIRWTIIAIGLFIGGFAGLFGFGIALILAFATYWLYGVGFEVLNNGVTPGNCDARLLPLRQCKGCHRKIQRRLRGNSARGSP